MARLDPKRNLPPASEAWGKTIEQRISYLERANTVLQSEIKNTSKGLNSLTTRLGSLRIFAANSGYTGAYPSEPWDPNEFHDVDSEWEIVGDPAIGYSSSGRLVCLGQVDFGGGVDVNSTQYDVVNVSIAIGTSSDPFAYTADPRGYTRIMGPFSVYSLSGMQRGSIPGASLSIIKPYEIPPGEFYVYPALRYGSHAKGEVTHKMVNVMSSTVTVISL